MSDYESLEREVMESYGAGQLPASNVDVKPAEVDYLLVAGIGGSGVVGRYLQAVCWQRWGRPVVVVGNPAGPVNIKGNYALLAISFSGNTLETVASYKKYRRAARSCAVITNGGELGRLAAEAGDPVLPAGGAAAPRFGLPTMFAESIHYFSEATRSPWALEGLVQATERLGQWIEQEKPVDLARRYASETAGSIPVIYGSEHLSAMAYRWKTQVNENAKYPAFHSDLPEANHNEVNAWGTTGSPGFIGVVITSPSLTSIGKAALNSYAEVAKIPKIRVQLSGDQPMDEILRGSVLGDLYSIELARIRQVDPMDISEIDRVKQVQAKILG